MKKAEKAAKAPHFNVYTYYHPEAVPFQRTDYWNKEMISAAGFDAAKDDVTFGILTAPWNNHPAGSIVITGPRKVGQKFAIEIH
jgi:hypothetical protein